MAPEVKAPDQKILDELEIYSDMFGYYVSVDAVAKFMNKPHDQVIEMEWMEFSWFLQMNSRLNRIRELGMM